MDKDMEEESFIYSVESLPRIQSVQVFLIPHDRNLSLTANSIETRGVDGHTAIHHTILNPHSLDLASHGGLKLRDGVLSMRFKSRCQSQEIPLPTGDILETCNSTELISIKLSCSFCNAQITRKGR